MTEDRIARALVGLLLAGVAACSPSPPTESDTASVTPSPGIVTGGSEPGPIRLVDRTDLLSPPFVHEPGGRGDLLAQVMGSGVALLDVEGDGDLDLFFVQSGPFLDRGSAAALPSDRLFSNRLAETGELGFEDVTARSGLGGTDGRNGATGYGMGVATGDIDDDGDVDLLVTTFEGDRLWRNRGDGTFEDATDASGIASEGWGASAAFVDLDGDGDLDLYRTGYVVHPWGPGPPCRSLTGMMDICGPLAFEPTPDWLGRNRGDGTFEEVPLGQTMPGLGVVAGDWDEDGVPDLYVANDGHANQLWTADAEDPWHLVDRALLSGTALSGEGQAEAGMGIAVGDPDGDGDEDLLVTHLDLETNTFYRNDVGFFEDRSTRSGLGAPSWERTGFGAAFVDLDRDGWQDLLVANGAVRWIQPLLDAGDPRALHQTNLVFHNQGGGEFEALDDPGVAAWTEPSEVSRGLAIGDLDDDGDPDVVLSNNGGPARIFLNEAGPVPWIGLHVLTRSGRDALGARVDLEGTARPRVARVRTAASYLSASDPRILFALPSEEPQEHHVVVTWPDDSKELFSAVVNHYSELRQGKGRPADG